MCRPRWFCINYCHPFARFSAYTLCPSTLWIRLHWFARTERIPTWRTLYCRKSGMSYIKITKSWAPYHFKYVLLLTHNFTLDFTIISPRSFDDVRWQNRNWLNRVRSMRGLSVFYLLSRFCLLNT